MEHRGGLAAVGEIHRRAYRRAGLGIHHRYPHAVIAGGPEVGGGALVHVPAAAVNVALPGSKNLCRAQAEQERGGTKEGIKAFQTISHSNLFMSIEKRHRRIFCVLRHKRKPPRMTAVFRFPYSVVYVAADIWPESISFPCSPPSYWGLRLSPQWSG